MGVYMYGELVKEYAASGMTSETAKGLVASRSHRAVS
jgi:hypothetical protein